MAEIQNSIANAQDGEVCIGAENIHDKQKVMNQQWYNSLFYSTGDTFKFLAGLMLAAGMGIIGSALKEASTFSQALSLAAGSEVGIAFLAVAAVCTAVAVGAQFMSSRYYHSGNFDALELNAQHTAKYMVKEIKKETMIAHHEQNQRADGKPWQQVVRPEQSAVQQVPSRS